MQRASELQTEAPIGGAAPPRLKPATWSDRGDAWIADPGDVTLLAKPTRASLEDGKVVFPKEHFPTQGDAMQALKNLYPGLAHADANPDGTFNLRNVEIFNTGTWNNHYYGPDQLDEMVRAYREIGQEMKPYSKLGHDDEHQYQTMSGLPAIGWMKNLRRDGNSLYADLMHVPETIFKAVEGKAYRTKSPEIYWNLKWGDKTYPYAIRAVSLLGAELPANPTLQDLYPLHTYTQNETQLEGELHVYDRQDSILTMDDLVGMLAPKVGKTPNEIHALLNPPTPEPLPPLEVIEVTPTPDINTDLEADRYAAALLGTSTGGLPVNIEVFKGQLRRWMRPEGTIERPLSADYGSIIDTLAPDGDPWDAFIGPDPTFAVPYILTIETPMETEEKILLGFSSIHDANACATHHYGVYAQNVRAISMTSLTNLLFPTTTGETPHAL